VKAGYTPLHTACHFGQMNMIRFLLDHGASVDATTKVSDALFTLHSRLYNPLYDRLYNRLDELCNERRLSGPARTIMTSLRRCAQQGGCVDSRRCGVFDRNLKEEFLFILPSVAYDPEVDKN